MVKLEAAKLAVLNCLKNIGTESKIDFREFAIEDHTNGNYRAGVWTYKTIGRRVAVEYWFSRFSSRKEEFQMTYDRDGDISRLEAQMRNAFDTVRDAVKRKKGMF